MFSSKLLLTMRYSIKRYCILTIRDLWGGKKTIINQVSLCFARNHGNKKRANVAVLAVAVCDEDPTETHFVHWQLGTTINLFTF